MERTIRSNGHSALVGTAGASVIADDDVGRDEAIRLVASGTIRSFEALNQTAIALHAGATVKESEREKE